MSFAAYETSIDEGRPVELLLVSFLTNHYTYTSAETEVVHDGRVYKPLPISRSEISNTGDVAKATLTIKIPYDCPVGDLFRVQPPPGVVSVTVFAKHAPDGEVKAIWKGRITNAEWEMPWLSLTTENVFTSLQRTGLRRRFSVQCTHPLYSTGHGLCNVDRDIFKRICPVVSLSGATIGCPAAAAMGYGYFSGGFVTWINNVSGNLERLMITVSDGAGNLTVTAAPRGLAINQQVTVYPGCDHSLATCHAKFNNALNCGCFEHIPQKNPFAGSTLY